jgi:hypothetical protein
MAFLIKEPCARALSDTKDKGSVFGALHDPDNYPHYFVTEDSTCSWLSELLSACSVAYEVCFFDRRFLIVNKDLCLPIFLPKAVVACCMFHPADVDNLVLKETL